MNSYAFCSPPAFLPAIEAGSASAPHEKDRTSISPLWSLSWLSPSMPPSFKEAGPATAGAAANAAARARKQDSIERWDRAEHESLRR